VRIRNEERVKIGAKSVNILLKCLCYRKNASLYEIPLDAVITSESHSQSFKSGTVGALRISDLPFMVVCHIFTLVYSNMAGLI